MDTIEVDALLARLLDDLGQGPAEREEVRVWARSGVERLHLADGTSVVFKYAEGPFAAEHHALAVAEDGGLPVPARLAISHPPELLGMLLIDLGPTEREATDAEGAALAVRVHAVTDTKDLPVLDEQGLAAMPEKIRTRLTRHDRGRSDLGLLTETAHALTKVADARAARAELAPFGLCHSEWHPTSIYVTENETYLLDFARAFRGPGLLDLASWHGTIDAPDPAKLSELITSYIAAGGPEEAAAGRGGLSPARWALGWHRVWVADWFTQQLTIGWAEGAEDAWISAISRHLTEAALLLRA
ncbi:Phosphotransferase enzyme family protein [Sinosporangium album]|uniref:Phosphotransferase enzyme family protein n=1 Tax=Sinosporangium album TaxID=504805 RepID=A0A1G8B6A4_9ACTN|nr:phosphotransferase [Sinosporangium album]SDH28160.1 Phosphotransferase enzyme family protein [Sinosporangium album]